ncbi:MAG TPA: hypothetical protein VMW81_01440, partial [Nitrospinota bacterium]|nr:hypothetical protein [Nitrospinota bacterium]
SNPYTGTVLAYEYGTTAQKAKDAAKITAENTAQPLVDADRNRLCPTRCQPKTLAGHKKPIVKHLHTQELGKKKYVSYYTAHWRVVVICPPEPKEKKKKKR